MYPDLHYCSRVGGAPPWSVNTRRPSCPRPEAANDHVLCERIEVGGHTAAAQNAAQDIGGRP